MEALYQSQALCHPPQSAYDSGGSLSAAGGACWPAEDVLEVQQAMARLLTSVDRSQFDPEADLLALDSGAWRAVLPPGMPQFLLDAIAASPEAQQLVLHYNPTVTLPPPPPSPASHSDAAAPSTGSSSPSLTLDDIFHLDDASRVAATVSSALSSRRPSGAAATAAAAAAAAAAATGATDGASSPVPQSTTILAIRTPGTVAVPPSPAASGRKRSNAVRPESDYRKQRHKQTQDARRKRINHLMDELRELLNLDPKAEKVSVLQLVKQTLSMPKQLPLSALEMRAMPHASLVLVCCTDRLVTDMNDEALRRLRLARDRLPTDIARIRVNEDQPYFFPTFLRLLLGLTQSIEACKRYRDAYGDMVWGRFTFTRILANDKIYAVGVGQFLDEPPPVPVAWSC